MDLRQYYAAVQIIEDQIGGSDALVVSEATPDGGRAGVVSEVSCHAAARLIVERKARLATAEEVQHFYQPRRMNGGTAQSQTIPATVIDTTTTRPAAPRARRG